MVRIFKTGKRFCAVCRGLYGTYSRNGAPDQINKHDRVRSGFGHPLKERCPGSDKPPLPESQR